MSSFGNLNSAPTVVLPQAPDQYFINRHYVDHNDQAPAINGISLNGLAASQSNKLTSNDSALGSLAGRKRSRGDVFSQEDEEEGRLEDGSITTPSTEELTKPRGQPVYGPGMTVSYPEDPGYTMTSESQSGTWVEECAERKPFELSHMKRPSVTSRKSQRVDARASESDNLAQLVLPPQLREITSEPLIDEATRSLGISWTRMDSTEALLINQAAYSKWIQNHYRSLENVSVWFENSALPGYLVATHNAYNGQQEYYIFSHDLTEARLVTTESSQLVPRLKMLPALHLAAPGGHIKAETDLITTSQNDPNGVQTGIANEPVYESQPSGSCAAHAMELD